MQGGGEILRPVFISHPRRPSDCCTSRHPAPTHLIEYDTPDRSLPRFINIDKPYNSRLLFPQQATTAATTIVNDKHAIKNRH